MEKVMENSEDLTRLLIGIASSYRPLYGDRYGKARVIAEQLRVCLAKLVEENTTPAGIKVQAGQKWRDLDKRNKNRVVTVINVESGFAYVTGPGPNYNQSKLSVNRMFNHPVGFELVSND